MDQKNTYHFFQEKVVDDFSESNIERLYDEGFVFTRLGKGLMHQVKSLRVELSRFSLSSENRRVLKKNEDLLVRLEALPYSDYNWKIGKMGFDFYRQKFGEGVMSANKIKELFVDPRSNMNSVFVYGISGLKDTVGYCLAYQTPHFIHYNYPFYDLSIDRSLGMAMMVKAIMFARESGRSYVYLGTAQRYKFQFEGVEWFSGKTWRSDAYEE